MSENIFEYKIVKNDSLGKIALRFYGTYEESLLRILKDINGLESIHLIREGKTLKLPYFIQYGSERGRSYVDQEYIYELKERLTALPIEFHHTELEGEPVAARRFIYSWKSEIPESFSVTDFNCKILDKLKESDKNKVKDFYKQTVQSYSVYWYLNKNKISDPAKKKELLGLLKKAGYPVWKNRGVLMTDDWGQPWRIEE